MHERDPRPRDAARTRADILAAARAAFARAGYDGVGVREIARDAGVTAMLINRYFGSKEGLFVAVIDQTMAEPVILSADNLAAPDFAARFAAALVDTTRPGATPLDGFLILLRSAGSQRAAELGRARIEAGHLRALTDAIAAPDAAERAAIALGLVAGFQVMRQMLGLTVLADAEPARLVALLTPLVASLVDRGVPPRSGG